MGVSNVFKIGLMVPNCSKDFMLFNDNSNNITSKEDHEKNDINNNSNCDINSNND